MNNPLATLSQRHIFSIIRVANSLVFASRFGHGLLAMIALDLDLSAPLTSYSF
jgi:hypothetical protein